MIPLRIEATNFGAIAHADIDLANVTLAAVCGPNGAGKSTLFTIAPIFALFGVTKNGCSVDDMVRTGTQEMGVVFDFEHRGETYRSTRTRSKKGKGKSTLELQRLVSGQWVSESGTTIRETEERIRELLNLDAETFTASSMILQGKANEFTSKPPGQRKSILAQILGLEVYERLQEAAKAKERVANSELEKAKVKLCELEKRLEAKPDLELEMIQVDEQLVSVARDVEENEKELRKAEELVRQLQAKVDRAEELWKQIENLTNGIEARQAEQQKQQGQLDRANEILARKEQIIAKSAEYEDIKQQLTVLRIKLSQLEEAKAEEAQVNQEINRPGETLKNLLPQIKSAEMALANRPALEKAAVEYKTAVSDLDSMDKQFEKWTDLVNKARNACETRNRELTNFDTITESLKIEIQVLKDKVSMLNNSGCVDPDKATCRFLADALEARAKLVQAENEYRNHMLDEEKIQVFKIEAHRLEKERDALGYDPQEHRRLKLLVNELLPKVGQAAQLGVKAELLKNLQAQKGQIEEQQRQLVSQRSMIQERIKTLKEEILPLANLEERLPKLEQWVKLKDELPAALQIVTSATERILALNQEILDKQERVKVAKSEWEDCLIAKTHLQPALDMVTVTRNHIRISQEKQNELHSRAGGLKAQLKSMAKDEEESQRLDAEMKPLAKILVRWRTLVKAFGRDGIPALIIENAVPELERISNEILGQMSKGENSLKFETQRELKSKDGRTETLDIIVGDWHGERPYETFSGGEQLRIDFAIRFALAELLAMRAGSRVEWLTIDEGLGSQDAEHRGLVLDAIKAVADRFRKTLVITHIEEAQAAFEQQIYFEPGEQGAEVRVA